MAEPMDESGAPASDAGEGAGEEEDEVLPEVSLEIFNTIKSGHAQHGLRHGDYERYRQYCSRRIHRVRTSTGFLHGKGRYVKRVMEPRSVRDSRFLMIPLYNAERAWAYAMALKRENPDDNPRARFRLLHRLNKAAKWSTALAKLSAIRGDKRTALEAEAYAGFMVGNMHLERERWGLALTHLRRTKTICTELCRVSMADQVHLYNQVVEEVLPSIRFCSYNLRSEGGAEGEGDDDGGDVEGLLDGGGAEGAGSDILRSKLEAVMMESRARQAKDLNEIDVLGERVPIKSDKVRIAILQSQKHSMEIAQASGPPGSPPAEGLMEKYDELFVAFNDALDGVRHDLRQASKEQSARSGAAESALLKLKASLTWQKLHHTVCRTLLLVESFKRSLAGEASSAAGSGGASGGGSKRAVPEDIVRLYDAVISSLSEMGTLDGYKDDEALRSQIEARQSAAKACRCFFLAESYGAAARFGEAQALYGRAEALLSDAVPMLRGAGYADSSAELVSLAKLEELIDGARARAHAQAFLESMSGGAPVAEAASGLDGMALLPTSDVALLDSLDNFDRAKPEHLVAFPPDFVTTPCKPLLFDIARNQLHPPDLSARIKASGGGGGYLSKASSWMFGR